jgi:hypothetical protein
MIPRTGKSVDPVFVDHVDSVVEFVEPPIFEDRVDYVFEFEGSLVTPTRRPVFVDQVDCAMEFVDPMPAPQNV